MNEVAEGVITNGQVVAKLDDGHYWAISLFGGGKGTTYAEALNRFRNELPESVKIYSMIAPTSGEYYLPSNFAEYNASHRKSVESVNSQLSEGIIPVDAISALGEHTDEPIVNSRSVIPFSSMNRPPLAASRRVLRGAGVCRSGGSSVYSAFRDERG